MTRDSKGRFCKEDKCCGKHKDCKCKQKEADGFETISFEQFVSELLGLPSRRPKKPVDHTLLRIQHMHARRILSMIDALTAFRISYCTGPSFEAAGEALAALNAELEKLELAMQDTCGYKKDPNKHTWWLKASFCTCPKDDNTDPAYFGCGKIISADCPVHSRDFNTDKLGD